MEKSQFETLLNELDAILSPVKFRLAKEVYDYAVFGSMYALWSRRGEQLRLVWDGRDSSLLLEVTNDGRAWRSLVPEHADAALVRSAARTHVGY